MIKQEFPHSYLELHIAKLDGSEDVLYYNGEVLFTSWAQDSERFVCQIGQGYQLGQLGAGFIPITDQGTRLSWAGSANFIYDYIVSGMAEIRLGFIGEPSISLVGPELSPIYFDFSNYCDWRA